ncbi:MAG: TonB-dependent receptor [Opitutales bacterium]|nr:TonB-dependent receptor [Opitutales bacterium]NRA28158.1 TonB-dependent receptor [Opitutales bacterium]
MKPNKLQSTALSISLAAASVLSAQEEEEMMVLEVMEGSGVAIEESVLPTTRPFNSVYGTDRSILETPRNVTIISREQLDAIAIKDVRDFTKLTSSSYTKTNFGAPSTPNLRGDESDLYVNGMRRGLSTNGNGLPINFNSVESVNIVKGPAGSVYGTTNYIGGYADLITKRPYFDAPAGEISVSVAQYDQYTWSLDYGAPISETLAFRVSYEGKEWDGFHEFWKNNSHALYGALTWRPNENYTLEIMGEYFQADYTENWGVNRVTQDLIDNGRYVINSQTDAEYAAYVATLGNGNSVFTGGTPGVDFASVFGGAGFATIVPTDGTTVPVDRSWKLAAPGDDSFGRFLWAQAIQTYDTGDYEIVNNTLFQYRDRDTFSSYHYSELMRDNWTLTNRTEFRTAYDLTEMISIDWNIGLRYHYQDVWSVNHFFNEPANFWDLTRDPDTRRVPDQGFAGFPIIPDQEPRGILSNWYYGGTGADTQTFMVGPFAQADIRFGDKVSLIAGYTTDYIETKQSDPVTGADELEGDGWLPNWNVSGVYNVTEGVSVYATYNFNEVIASDTGGRIDVQDFDNAPESELIEFGVKFSLLEDTLFIGAAYFDFNNITVNQDGSVDEREFEGFEIEANYQPNPNLWLTVGYSYIDSQRTAGFFASPYTIDRADETGGYYVSPLFQSPDGFVENPGVPEHTVNALVSYKWDNGFGLRAGFQGWGEMNSGYGGYPISVFDVTDFFGNGSFEIEANTARLPFQYEIDLTAFYEYENWFFKATVYNVTDEDNWDVNNSGYGNGSIVARAPARWEGTVTYTW